MASMGKLLIIAGIVLIALGVIVVLAQNIPFLGRLPGDIRIHGEKWSFCLPLATCLAVSIALTLLLNLIAWLFFRR